VTEGKYPRTAKGVPVVHALKLPAYAMQTCSAVALGWPAARLVVPPSQLESEMSTLASTVSGRSSFKVDKPVFALCLLLYFPRWLISTSRTVHSDA
jgi:hypothetical protein